MDSAINLDAGAAHPGQTYGMTRSGFVPPSVPQTKALSTSSIIYQAEKDLEEAQVFMEEAHALYNDTAKMAADVEEKNAMVQDLAASASRDEEASSRNAADSLRSLQEVEDIYNKTVELHRDCELLALDIKNDFNLSDGNLIAIKGYLEESRLLYNQTLDLLESISLRSAQMEQRLQENDHSLNL